MQEYSYLDPELIRAQCASAVANINEDLLALDVAEKAIQNFLDDKSLKAISFDKLKESMVQYKYYISQLREADKWDIFDFVFLSTNVGNEVLSGRVILSNKWAARDSKESNDKSASDYAERAHYAKDVASAAYYRSMSCYHSMLAANDYARYLYWLGKEEKYDKIENATKNLFRTSAYYRLNCMANPNNYNPCALEIDFSPFGDDLKNSLKKSLELVQKDKEIYDKAIKCSDPTQLTAYEKEVVIRYYESTHRDAAQKMNKAMKPFYDANYDEHATNIKVLTYTAPEPYRSAFINNCADIKVKDIHWGKTCHYNPDAKGIYINVDRFKQKDADAYNVYFHEMSHGIDDKYSKNGKALSAYYTNGDNKTTKQILEEEVRQKVDSYANKYASSFNLSASEQKKLVEKVENDIMNRIDDKNDPAPVISDTKEKYVYLMTKTAISNELSGRGSVSDVYGGYTGNTLKGDCYHEAVRKENPDKTIEYRLYWVEGSIDSNGTNRKIDYDKNGDVKYSDHLPSEFFAENMAANMTRTTKEMRGYNYYSQESRDIFNDMVSSIR